MINLQRHTSMREMLGNTSMMKIILTVCSRLRKLSEKVHCKSVAISEHYIVLSRCVIRISSKKAS